MNRSTVESNEPCESGPPVRRADSFPFGDARFSLDPSGTSPSSFSVDSAIIQLRWIIRLRWLAVVGQSVTILFVFHILQIDIPLPVLFSLVAITLASNFVATLASDTLAGSNQMGRWTMLLLALDVLTLTGLLAFTGGLTNPFTTFYLVHATLAAITLPRKSAVAIGALGLAGCGSLFLAASHLPIPHFHDICGVAIRYELHLKGLLVALALSGASIGFFSSRLLRALQEREAALAQARQRALDHERFASLATLAAGVAHEIGSPLATIAIAAGELRRAAVQQADSTVLEDAELISDEVRRCRTILDKLSARSGALGDLPQVVSVDSLIESLGPAVPNSLQSRIKIHREPSAHSIYAPPTALAQALGVLIQNAIDSSPPSAPVELRIDSENGFTRFQVLDSGSGITPAIARHAGEPYFSTKTPERGMGLGLYLVRLLAERLHGSFQLRPHDTGAPGSCALLCIPTPMSLGLK